MNRLKMAVVGVGALGRHHARILSQLESVELVAVAESNPVVGQAVAESCRTRWVADCSELYNQVDAVSIVVPTFAHRSVAGEFLKRRIPVLVEKPLASNLEQAEQIVELAEQHGTTLQVGHIERFNPATAVAWKECGPPKYIRAERTSPYAFRSTDIGVVLDVMIHDLDLVLDLVKAKVHAVEAFGTSILGENEDCVQARVTFENGCIADVTANRVNPTARRAMQIWSHEGTVTVDFTSREVVVYRPSPALVYGTSPLQKAKQPGADIEQLKREVFGTYLKVERPSVPPGDALTAELASFVDCVQHNRRPLVDGATALRAMQLADDVLNGVHSHQWDGHAQGPIGPFARFQQRHRRAG
jgi:predicted dehydrogenase